MLAVSVNRRRLARTLALADSRVTPVGDIQPQSEPSGNQRSDRWTDREVMQTPARQILALCRTTRPLSSLVAGTLSASVVIAAQDRWSLVSVVAGTAMTLVTMFGFVINDVVDFDKDAQAGVRRPIATRELSRRRAMLFAVALLLSAYLISLTESSGATVLAATSAALIVYSPLAQRFPIGKGAYVAVLCCAPLLYGSVIVGVQRSWLSYATLACFVLGREAFMDADEMVGDRRSGIETIAAILGHRRARRAGVLVMLMSAVLIVCIERGGVGRIAALAALVSLVLVLQWPGLSEERRIHLSRFPMLIGAVAIACGTQ